MVEVSEKTQGLLSKLGMTIEDAMNILLKCIIYSDESLRKDLESASGLEKGYITFGDSLAKLHVDKLGNNEPLTNQEMKELAVGLYLMGLFDSTGFGLARIDEKAATKNSLTDLID